MSEIGIGVEPKADGSDRHTQDHQRMESYQPDFKKFFYAHLTPSVIIGVTHYESGEQIKKINRQITVMHGMIRGYGEISFEQMVYDDQDRGRATQSVQYGIMWFHRMEQSGWRPRYPIDREYANVGRYAFTDAGGAVLFLIYIY